MDHGIRHHSLDPSPFFKGGGANFNYLPWREKSEKLKGRVEVWWRGRSTDTFPVQFFEGLSFLHLEITLTFAKLCYVFLSATIILLKRSF